MCLQDNLLDQLDCVGFLILILITTTMCVVCPLVPAVDVSTQYTALLDCRKDSAVATLGWVTCTTYNLTQIYIHQDCISTLIFSVCRCGFCDPVSGVVCNSQSGRRQAPPISCVPAVVTDCQLVCSRPSHQLIKCNFIFTTCG